MSRVRRAAWRDSHACRAHRAKLGHDHFLMYLEYLSKQPNQKTLPVKQHKKTESHFHELLSTFTSSLLCSVHRRRTLSL
jgi:hypothetical protein